MGGIRSFVEIGFHVRLQAIINDSLPPRGWGTGRVKESARPLRPRVTGSGVPRAKATPAVLDIMPWAPRIGAKRARVLIWRATWAIRDYLTASIGQAVASRPPLACWHREGSTAAYRAGGRGAALRDRCP